MGKSIYPAHCVIHEDTKAACWAVTGADFHVMRSSCWRLQCKCLMLVFSFFFFSSLSFLFPPTPFFFILKKNWPIADIVKLYNCMLRSHWLFPFLTQKVIRWWQRRLLRNNRSLFCRASRLWHCSYFWSEYFLLWGFLWIIGCLGASLGLCSLDDSCTCPLVTTKMSLDIPKCSLGNQIAPGWSSVTSYWSFIIEKPHWLSLTCGYQIWI